MTLEPTNCLCQKLFPHGAQRLEILSDGNLEVSFKRWFLHRQFKVPLWQIDPEPERVRHRPLGALIATAVFSLIFLGMFAWWFVERKTTPGILYFAGLFLVLALLCWWKLKAESVNILSSPLRHGGGLHLWFENPNAKAFEEFCSSLKKKADEAWRHRPAQSGNTSLAAEISDLKKLVDTGVLSEAEFEKAKAKLIEAASERRIGFN